MFPICVIAVHTAFAVLGCRPFVPLLWRPPPLVERPLVCTSTYVLPQAPLTSQLVHTSMIATARLQVVPRLLAVGRAHCTCLGWLSSEHLWIWPCFGNLRLWLPLYLSLRKLQLLHSLDKLWPESELVAVQAIHISMCQQNTCCTMRLLTEYLSCVRRVASGIPIDVICTLCV